MSKIRFIGLDVHADTIAAAVAEPDGEVRPLGVIRNRLESIRKLITKLGPVQQVKACYEAGPTGYVLYWQLAALGVACEVVAPSLVPVKAGDRVKTDRRDSGQTGAQLPCRRSHAGLGSRRRARSSAGSGAGPRGCPRGSAAGTAAVG